MMKVVFVYYSLEGNCRALSDAMAGATGGQAVELQLVNDIFPKTGIMKYVKGGKAALFKETPELQPLTIDLKSADVIVVGGPVWFGRITPAVRTFLNATDWTGKKAAVFAMYRGGKGSAAKDIAGIISQKGGTVLATTNFKDLRKNKAENTLEDAVQWAQELTARHG